MCQALPFARCCAASVQLVDETAGPSANQIFTELGGEDYGSDQNRKVYRIQEKEAGIVAEAIGGADRCHG